LIVKKNAIEYTMPGRYHIPKRVVSNNGSAYAKRILTAGQALSSKAFLNAEALGSRLRQRSAPLDASDVQARLRARITLATVKGYWE
jgi:hypothetical protein